MSTQSSRRRPPFGFTLVELLVVVTIIGMLLALLLPAVQATREAARRAHCKNNLKQIAFAMIHHHEKLERFPSGGWGPHWIGEPERGTSGDQPGGWMFNILDYIEQGTVRNAGLGLYGAARAEAIALRLQTPLSRFSCPSRRRMENYIHVSGVECRTGTTSFVLPAAARSDYAANSGDVPLRIYLTEIAPLLEPYVMYDAGQDESLFVQSGDGGIPAGLIGVPVLPITAAVLSAGQGGDSGHAHGKDTQGKITVHEDGTLTLGGQRILPELVIPHYALASPHTHGFKIFVCHAPPGNPANERSIEIDINAVVTHLDHHPDYLGPCNGSKVDDLNEPTSLADGDDPNFNWNTSGDFNNGIVGQRSGSSAAGIGDGISNTFLCGEKYMNSSHYATGKDPGDDLNMYAGFSNDNHRWTGPALGPPRRDDSGIINPLIFGSSHPAAYHQAFADGSVHPISYHIDPVIHGYLGSRNDGQRVPQHMW